MKMKALLLEDINTWSEMKVGEAQIPTPNTGEIVVQVHAVGLNPVDYKTATRGLPTWNYPHILGLDVAGTIVQRGSGVTHLQEGDRVVYHGDFTKQGGYAQFAVTTAHTVSVIPESISFETAAAIPTAGYTAYQALFRKLPIHKLSSILIHGGAGGVGGFGVQLAKLAGLTVISTASTTNHSFVQSLGADYLIDYNEENVLEKVMQFTEGRGVDAVLDTVSRENATASLDMVAYGGHIAYIAGAPDFTKIKPFSKVISYHEIALGAAHHQKDILAQKDLATMGKEMLELLEQKKLDAMVHELISLEEVPEALVKLSERHVRGKIVVQLTN